MDEVEFLEIFAGDSVMECPNCDNLLEFDFTRCGGCGLINDLGL